MIWPMGRDDTNTSACQFLHLPLPLNLPHLPLLPSPSRACFAAGWEQAGRPAIRQAGGSRYGRRRTSETPLMMTPFLMVHLAPRLTPRVGPLSMTERCSMRSPAGEAQVLLACGEGVIRCGAEKSVVPEGQRKFAGGESHRITEKYRSARGGALEFHRNDRSAAQGGRAVRGEIAGSCG